MGVGTQHSKQSVTNRIWNCVSARSGVNMQVNRICGESGLYMHSKLKTHPTAIFASGLQHLHLA